MALNVTRIQRRVFVGVSILLVAVLLAGGYVLFVSPRYLAHAFVVLLDMGVTCNDQLDVQHCNDVDPVNQRCVTPNTTTVSRNIVAPDGQVVGRVDRRYSPACHTSWGRVFDYRHINGSGMMIQNGGNIVYLPYNDVGYGDMTFEPGVEPVPAVIGTLMTNGKYDPMLSATVPVAFPIA